MSKFVLETKLSGVLHKYAAILREPAILLISSFHNFFFIFDNDSEREEEIELFFGVRKPDGETPSHKSMDDIKCSVLSFRFCQMWPRFKVGTLSFLAQSG